VKQEHNLFRKGTGTTSSPLVVFSAAQQTLRFIFEMELSGNRVEIVGSIDAPTTVTRAVEYKN